MIISQGISLLLEEKLFTDKDTAHYLSYPVIRKEKEKYYMAVFYVFLTMKEAESGKVGRPLNWAILDIESGNVVEKRKTGNNEFCDAPKNKKYNVISEHACPNPVEYYNTAFDILDAVRVKIIESNEFNSVLYQKYLEMILEYTSNDFKQFYTGLSDVPDEPHEPRQNSLDYLPWNPRRRVTQIPEDIFQRAMDLVHKGLIKKVNILQDKKLAQIVFNFEPCTRDFFKKEITEIPTSRTLMRNLRDGIDTCNSCTCNEMRCIPHIAGYIYYVKENDLLKDLLREREEYRQSYEDQDAALHFKWEPLDKEAFYHLPLYVYDIAQDLIDRGFITLRPYLDINKRFHIDFRALGQCVAKDENGRRGNVGSSATDIKRALACIDGDNTEGLTDGWVYNTDHTVTNSLCANCDAAICPYPVAAYMLYLQLTGQEGEIEFARQHAKEGKNIYYGQKTKYEFTEAHIDAMKQNIFTASSDMIDAATAMLDSGDATLHAEEIRKKTNTGDWITFYRVYFGRKLRPVPTLEDCVSEEYSSEIDWQGESAFGYFKGITLQQRLVRLIGSLDYCRRNGISIDDIMEQRKQYLKDFGERSNDVQGLSRLYSFIKSENTSSLAAIIQGDAGSGKQAIIDSIATTLAQTGKIKSPQYVNITFDLLMKCLAIEKPIEEYAEDKKVGPYYIPIKPNVLHVITGLRDFLRRMRAFKGDFKADNIYAAEHVVETLGKFTEDTYVIVISESKEDTEDFIALERKFNFTFGQNIVVFKNKDTQELYEEYLSGLSDDVAALIDDKDALQKKFAEFITFNERFLPFRNTALAHYLSEYSNVEGKPIFPPDIYDKRKTQDALDNLVGMDAVKKQIKDFESYITYQKRAQAAGIEVERGNLHMQFLGNAGTGKTTIARILAKMLYEIGILSEDKLVEVERKDMIAEYLGQTAIKTGDKIKEAMGGVLFIDEAYSLNIGERDMYGKEAIATLIKAMEDHKNDFIVIFAGYSKEMQEFLKANTGIESRIGYTFRFDDYTASELTEIFKRNMEKQHFALGDGVIERVSDICDYYRRRKNFGNGRFVKKIEQQTIINHAKRSDLPGWTVDAITIEDMPDTKDFATKTSDKEENAMTLDRIVGMQPVKDQIKKFKTKIKFEQNAKSAGAKIRHGNSHMLFLGNAGTGKTTIARILTKELYEAGVILENKLVEVERKDLVGEYIGQTAIKTADIIDSAMGGVLFIDEAYALTPPDNGRDFGQEAVATLVKAMEDHRDEFVVIFAGYEKEMENFIDSNSGIASRIGYTFTFEDYNSQELTDIFKVQLDLNGLSCTDEAAEAVKKVMQYFVSVPNFGNGRFSERVMNVAVEMHAERIAESGEIKDDLLVITKDDVPTVKYLLDHMPDGKNMINPENIKDAQNERTAVHELGHALLQKLLDPENSIKTITILAEGSGALGYVQHSNDAIYTPTKSVLESRICVLMAGIASEEVFLGEYGNGGTSDLERATSIAQNMVSKYGMLKDSLSYVDEIDEHTRQEVNTILKAQLERAQTIIVRHKEELLEAKNFLIEKETISDEEFSKFITIEEDGGNHGVS